MERRILHCDMNNFFASVELLDKPEYRAFPVCVCGDEEKRHGIVLAKNDIAKKAGIVTGETVFKAREKVPELITLPPHYEKYVAVSRVVRKILSGYTDLVEPFGIDECWMDVSGSVRLFGDGRKIADEIRNVVKKTTGLTCSVGVSFNKVFAKLGSDLKKPDATSIISEGDFREKTWHLPATDMIGVGRKLGYDLSVFGIKTIGDLAKADGNFLETRYGKAGHYIKEHANGRDFSPVMPFGFEFPIKSIGHGVTLERDVTTESEVWRVMLELVQDVGEKLRFHKRKARGISVAVRDKFLFRREFQETLPFPTDSNGVILKASHALFVKRYDLSVPVRSITIRAINLEDTANGVQLSMFPGENGPGSSKIDETLDKIRKTFGKNSLFPCTLLTDPFYDEMNKTKVSTLPSNLP